MIAMNYLDRVLARSVDHPPESKEEVQLFALTCFYLAVKLFQAGPVLSTQQMSILSGGMYTAAQVSSTEQRLLFALNWRLHPPCAADFVRPFFMVIMRNKDHPTDLCHYDVLELALGMLHTGTLDYFFVNHQVPPSHMAAAALLNAMHAVLPASYSIPSVQDLVEEISKDTGCSLHDDQINLCRQRFWSLLECTGIGRQSSQDSVPPMDLDCPTTPPPKRIETVLTPQPSPSDVCSLSSGSVLPSPELHFPNVKKPRNIPS